MSSGQAWWRDEEADYERLCKKYDEPSVYNNGERSSTHHEQMRVREMITNEPLYVPSANGAPLRPGGSTISPTQLLETMKVLFPSSTASSLDELHEQIVAWQERAFGPNHNTLQTPATLARHLLSECIELCVALNLSPHDIADEIARSMKKAPIHGPNREFADVFLVWCGLGNRMNVDACSAVRDTYNSVSKREYARNADGLYEHVKEEKKP